MTPITGFRQWLETTSLYQTAMEKLRPSAELWAVRGKGKRFLFYTYRQLSQEERQAIDEEIKNTFLKRYGKLEIELYRRSTDNENVGGMSLSEIPSNDPFVKKRKFLVQSQDVMLHWAQPNSVLMHMFHEREVILKPDAQPQEIDISHQYLDQKSINNREVEADPKFIQEMVALLRQKGLSVTPQMINTRENFYRLLEKTKLSQSDYEDLKDAYETGYEGALYRIGKIKTNL